MNKQVQYWLEKERKLTETRAAGNDKTHKRDKDGKLIQIPISQAEEKVNRMREGINRHRAHRRTITDFC
jgi:uncharacterized protein YuzE